MNMSPPGGVLRIQTHNDMLKKVYFRFKKSPDQSKVCKKQFSDFKMHLFRLKS